jgi:hypothetical protein
LSLANKKKQYLEGFLQNSIFHTSSHNKITYIVKSFKDIYHCHLEKLLEVKSAVCSLRLIATVTMNFEGDIDVITGNFTTLLY